MSRPSHDLFAGVSEAYEHARPGYADDAVTWFAERLAIRPESRIADVGAGTGKLTRQLVGLGADVVAVDPQQSMRAQFAAVLPTVAVLEGVAESLPLESASLDAITVGTAFHWFDASAALAEFARVLRPGGGVAVFLNYPDETWSRSAALEEIADISSAVQRRMIRFETQDARGHFATGTNVFSESDRFHDFDEHTFRFDHVMDREQLVARYESFAFFAALPEIERAATIERIRQIAARVPEPIVFPTVTHVSIARLRP